MIDRARTVADIKKSSTTNRASASQASTTAGKEMGLAPAVGEPIIPHGPYPTLMASLTTQTEAMMAEIKNCILHSGLQMGDASPTESQLCTDLGVPHSSVREAVRTLVALDVVEVRHGHGMSVGQVSIRPMVESPIFKNLLNPGNNHRGLRDIVEVRITLDSALAGPVIRVWHNHHDPGLNTLVDNVEHLASQDKLFTDQDHCFYTRLLQPLDNYLYLHPAEAFWATHTLTVPLLDAPKLKNPTSTARAHRAMFQAAHTGNTPTCRRAITDHYAPLLTVLT